MILEQPQPRFTATTLEPDPVEVGRTKRGANNLPDRLDGWLEIGETIAVPLGSEQAKDDLLLAQYLQQQDGYQFAALHFACSFKPPPDAVFHDAWFEIQLLSVANGAVAWSMSPERMGELEKVTETLSIGADLKFTPLEIGGSGERKVELSMTDLHIEAQGLMGNNPAWEFLKSKTREIRGVYRLAMIVRVPAANETRVLTRLSANVEGNKFGLFKFVTPFAADAERELVVG